MKRIRTLLLSFSVILVTLLTGCSHTLRVPPAEAPSHPDVRYTRMVKAAHATAVYLKADSLIGADSLVKVDFDQNGGRVDVARMTVDGVDTRGEERSFAIDSLSYVEFKPTDAGRQYMPVSALTKTLRDTTISMARMQRSDAPPCYDVIDFKNGGVYDPKANAIVGMTSRGTRVRTPMNQVYYLQYSWREWHTGRIFRAGLGLAAAAAVASGGAVVFDPK